MKVCVVQLYQLGLHVFSGFSMFKNACTTWALPGPNCGAYCAFRPETYFHYRLLASVFRASNLGLSTVLDNSF